MNYGNYINIIVISRIKCCVNSKQLCHILFPHNLYYYYRKSDARVIMGRESIMARNHRR